MKFAFVFTNDFRFANWITNVRIFRSEKQSNHESQIRVRTVLHLLRCTVCTKCTTCPRYACANSVC